jgi:glycine/D-amino acid oxidase-like deaminating enzyme
MRAFGIPAIASWRSPIPVTQPVVGARAVAFRSEGSSSANWPQMYHPVSSVPARLSTVKESPAVFERPDQACGAVIPVLDPQHLVLNLAREARVFPCWLREHHAGLLAQPAQTGLVTGASGRSLHQPWPSAWRSSCCVMRSPTRLVCGTGSRLPAYSWSSKSSSIGST